jgi:hypothetical protein
MSIKEKKAYKKGLTDMSLAIFTILAYTVMFIAVLIKTGILVY